MKLVVGVLVALAAGCAACNGAHDARPGGAEPRPAPPVVPMGRVLGASPDDSVAWCNRSSTGEAWLLHATVAGEVRVVAEGRVPDLSPLDPPRTLLTGVPQAQFRVSDVDGDGVEDVFVHAGAAWMTPGERLHLLRACGETVQPLVNIDDRWATLPHGGREVPLDDEIVFAAANTFEAPSERTYVVTRRWLEARTAPCGSPADCLPPVMVGGADALMPALALSRNADGGYRAVFVDALPAPAHSTVTHAVARTSCVSGASGLECEPATHTDLQTRSGFEAAGTAEGDYVIRLPDVRSFAVLWSDGTVTRHDAGMDVRVYPPGIVARRSGENIVVEGMLGIDEGPQLGRVVLGRDGTAQAEVFNIAEMDGYTSVRFAASADRNVIEIATNDDEPALVIARLPP